jgi:hypothetical protein
MTQGAVGENTMSAVVLEMNLFALRVCVPADWAEAEIIAFAEKENPCGTTHGWQIRREGSPFLEGAKERVQCASLSTNVHLVLEA